MAAEVVASPDADFDGTESLFVAGDLVLRHGVGAPLFSEALADRIADADTSMVNLEAAVPVDRGPCAKSGPAIQTAPETPALLAGAGVDAVTLANNHVMDYGVEGLERTRRDCLGHGVDTCGAGPTASDAIEPFRTTVGDTTVAVFSVCEREFGVARDAEPGTAWTNHPSLSGRIEAAAETSDVVVVAEHGGVEGVPLPPPGRRTRLREFVEDGADVVVGHHPHVPQGWEVYRGSPILFSLGNFLFPMPERPSTHWGLSVAVHLGDGTPVGVELVPTELVGDTVHELGERRDRVATFEHLDRVASLTRSPGRFRAHWQVIADRTFTRRYAGWLGESLSGHCSLRQRLSRVLPSVEPSQAMDDGDALTLLNLVRNESHREVIQTVLEVRAGKRPDRRGPEARERVDDLLDWTLDDGPTGRRRVEHVVSGAIRRLRGVVP